MDQRMVDAINKQINAELWSAYIYYAMAAWFEENDLPGMANWMKVQVQEELFHADKFFNFVAERGGRVVLSPIADPGKDWDSAAAVFEHAYQHEQWVTSNINGLMDLAIELKDHATASFLQWYVDEQVEEEANTSKVAQQLRMVEGSASLFMLDKELGARVFTPPTAAAQ
ncbi:MAG: ferritin [Armatimonadota bacterium]